MIITTNDDWVEQALDAGELRCTRSGCGGTLRRDGYARKRRVRTRSGTERELRPRRVRCARCGKVQVLLPAWCVPRRADDMHTIGVALLHAALGRGHRAIAALLDRPASTVRGWLRAARANARRAGRYAYLKRRLMKPQEATLTRSAPPTHTPLAFAVDDLGTAAATARRYFGVHAQLDPWAALTIVGGFLLLAPARFEAELPPAR